jgi:hypothetical protein
LKFPTVYSGFFIKTLEDPVSVRYNNVNSKNMLYIFLTQNGGNMTLIEFEELLNQYRGNFTQQSLTMLDFEYENEYIKIVRIDCSNKAGGKTVVGGKQWGIIFEFGERDFRQLKKWRELISRFNDIRITPRRGYNGQYGIRFYNMSLCPDENIVNAFIEYLFT